MHDDLLEWLKQGLSVLSPADQRKAVENIIATVLPTMPMEKIEAIREEIKSECDPNIEIVDAVLNLIEGHLELRRMSGE